MANGYGNIVGRGRALDLASYRPRSSEGGYRRPKARYNRPKSFNPNLDLNDRGSANEQRAARQAVLERATGNREVEGAQRRSAIARARQEEAEARRAKDAADIGRLRDLRQTVTGTSAAQAEEQQRRIAMEREREAEEERNRFRGTVEVMGSLRSRMNEAKDGQLKLSPQEIAGMTRMVPGWSPTLDRDSGKVRDVFVRVEASGEPGSDQQVLSFYQGGQDGQPAPVSMRSGEPVRVNTGVAEEMARLYDVDRRERTGFPGVARKVRQEEANIQKTLGEAAKAFGEGAYASAGKPGLRGVRGGALQLQGKDRAKALVDIQIQLTELRNEAAYYLENEEPVPAGIADGINALTQEFRRISALPVEGSRAGAGGRGVAAPPAAALDALYTNPTEEMIEQFEAKYGFVPTDLVDRR